jgi:hypothetical protein
MDDRSAALRRLEPLVGRWSLEASFARFEAGGEMEARTSFEWTLGGQYLLQRAKIDIPEAPDTMAMIDVDASGDGYVQHYFDSRGVTRIYAMTFDGRTWTLARDADDFTPAKFAQRFTGELSDDGSRIDGTWEIALDGTTFEKDLGLIYTRLA